MQNNSLVQIKLKTNEFIQDYEKQVTERQYQKQKLKQNIMLQIMSNRHKSQTSQSNANDLGGFQAFNQQNKMKRSTAAPASQNRSSNLAKGSSSEFIRSNSVPNALKNDIESNSQENNHLQCGQITFKMSKNRINYVFQNRPQQNQQYDDKAKLQDNYQQDQKQTLRDLKNKLKKNTDSVQQLNQNFQKSKKYQITERSQKFSQKFRPKQPQVKPESQQSDKQDLQQQNYKQNNAPIFLTLQQNQSMDISQQNKNKNYAFDIVMDKSQPIQDIQQLRKKKIQQMQKKRQHRLQQFRKQEQVKKTVNQEKQTRRSNSFLKNSIKSNSRVPQQVQAELPKSRNKKKPSVQKQSKINSSYQNIDQESHYNMKPPQPQRVSYYNQIQKEGASQQPIQTPKTINSEYRIDKSKGKNTIFKQSPKRNDKSTSKYSQEPKIEPKQRKNTFVKQSNKKLLITAITNVCLPGEINRKERQKLTQVIQKQQAEFFVLLFKQYSRKVVKGIYVLDPSQSYLQKIYGDKSPSEITSQQVQSFYRFDSGSRQFKKLDGCKSFSLVVHAIDMA